LPSPRASIEELLGLLDKATEEKVLNGEYEAGWGSRGCASQDGLGLLAGVPQIRSANLYIGFRLAASAGRIRSSRQKYRPPPPPAHSAHKKHRGGGSGGVSGLSYEIPHTKAYKTTAH